MSMADQCSPGEGVGAVLEAATEVIAQVVATLEPEGYTGAEAASLVERFTRIERLGAAGKALTARRVAETDAWRSSGARSAADWLGRTTGTTAGQAAQTLATSKQLKDHPDIDAAVRAAKLSSTQAAEIAGAAKDAPAEAARLIGRAQADSVQGLRQDCQAVKAASGGEESAVARRRRIHAGRYLRSWIDSDGAGRLDGKLSAETLAWFRAMLKPFEQAEFEAARGQGRTEPYQAYTLDALLTAIDTATTGHHGDKPMDPSGGAHPTGSASNPNGNRPGAAGEPADADAHAHAHAHPATTFGNPGSSTPAGAGADDSRTSGGGPGTPNGAGTPGDRGQADRQPSEITTTESGPAAPAAKVVRAAPGSPAMVIVRIDHAALIRGATQGGECSEIDGVGPVPVEVVRAMMADAFLAAVVTDGIDIRAVAHLGRSVTATQRTALYVRDPECVVPGCHVRTRLEIDHVQGWAATRVTRLDALARLCHFHHGRKTHEGWILRGPPGHWTFTPPDHDDPSPARPPPNTPGPSPPGPAPTAPRPVVSGTTGPLGLLLDP